LPKKVILVEEITRNSAGKIDKLAIRQLVREHFDDLAAQEENQ
jgi:hypothetical protein